jgi:integrase
LAEWQRQRLAEGAGPAVLAKAQTLLGQILKLAVLPYEYLDSNPVLALDSPRWEKKQHRWLTAAEVEALRSWYLEHDDAGSALLLSILAYIGIRPQDALALEASDIGKELSVTKTNRGGVIVPGSKTGLTHRRRVKIPEPVRADLEGWVKTEGLIFPRAIDGQPWSKYDWDNWRSRQPIKGKRPKCFKRAAEDVGLGSNLKPYDLRHTAASLMAACGWASTEIAHQLGHSTSESERTYQHLLDTGGQRQSIDAYILEARGVRDSFGVEAK